MLKKLAGADNLYLDVEPSTLLTHTSQKLRIFFFYRIQEKITGWKHFLLNHFSMWLSVNWLMASITQIVSCELESFLKFEEEKMQLLDNNLRKLKVPDNKKEALQFKIQHLAGIFKLHHQKSLKRPAVAKNITSIKTLALKYVNSRVFIQLWTSLYFQVQFQDSLYIIISLDCIA